jgi:hypothetical protein
LNCYIGISGRDAFAQSMLDECIRGTLTEINAYSADLMQFLFYLMIELDNLESAKEVALIQDAISRKGPTHSGNRSVNFAAVSSKAPMLFQSANKQ